MKSILLRTRGDGEKLLVGKSKMFGNPDVWDDFVWPFISIDNKEYDLTFMCQINCADAAKYDTNGFLPKTGMLYFFYDLDGMPWQPSDKNAARVLYYDGDINQLHEMMLTDENGESIDFHELKIEFEYTPEGYLSDSEPMHLLLGVPSIINEQDAYIKDNQMLLQIDSFETENAMINFTDKGVLCFFIQPNKLKQLDFSDVRIKQIYN